MFTSDGMHNIEYYFIRYKYYRVVSNKLSRGAMLSEQIYIHSKIIYYGQGISIL